MVLIKNLRVLQVFGGVGAALIAIAAFRWFRKWKAEAGARETMEVLRQIQRERPSAAARPNAAENAGEDTSTCRVAIQLPKPLKIPPKNSL